jgi:hypothetical protein
VLWKILTSFTLALQLQRLMIDILSTVCCLSFTERGRQLRRHWLTATGTSSINGIGGAEASSFFVQTQCRAQTQAQTDVDQRRTGWSKRRSFSSSELIGQHKTKAAAATAAAVPGGSHRVRSDRRQSTNGVGGMSTVSHAVPPVAHRNDAGTTNSVSKYDDCAVREAFLDVSTRRDVGGIATRDVTATIVGDKRESKSSNHNVTRAMLLVMDNENADDERERTELTNISTLMTSLSMAVTEFRSCRSPSETIKFENRRTAQEQI